MINVVYASIGETGRGRGNRAGDQTGKEVKVAPWYNFGQDTVIRFKDRRKAKQFVHVMKTIADNPCVGYDMNDRRTLHAVLEKHNHDYTKIDEPCETDCSNMVSEGLQCIGINVSPDIWTGNMEQCLMETGHFRVLKDSKYLKSDKYLRKGDIILNTLAHVVTACDDGAKGLVRYTVKYNMNFRKSAKIDKHNKIGRIPKGTVIRATRRSPSSDWLETTYKGKTGYVRLKNDSKKKVYCVKK